MYPLPDVRHLPKERLSLEHSQMKPKRPAMTKMLTMNFVVELVSEFLRYTLFSSKAQVSPSTSLYTGKRWVLVQD